MAKPKETLFDYIMSKEYQAKLMCPAEADDLARACHHLAETGDPIPAVKCYVSRNEPILVWLGEHIIESRKPKRDGRHSSHHARFKQLRSDLLCFFAVNALKGDGMRQTPAETKTGEAMHLTRQAVHQAYDRIHSRYSPKK